MIDSQLYSLDLAPVVWALLAAMVLCAAIVACALWPKLKRVAAKAGLDDAEGCPDGGYPAVSVIVYSQANGGNLRTLLPQILEQDYPAPIEVVVANDESADNTETVVSELEMRYPNLYMTFAPEHSRSLSRRKLSITLGVKAARYDMLVFTCGNCRIDSPLWLRAMMRHVVEGADVVLGYAAPVGPDGVDADKRRRRRAFDHVWQSVRWLSAALCGRPFMGTAYNMAYKRHLFFEQKGFSKTLNLRYGDDDIFVNEITRGRNTAVELGKDSLVRAIEYAPAHLHDVYAVRRSFTRSYLPGRPYAAMSAACVALWFVLPLGVVASVLSWPSLVAEVATLVTLLAVCVPTMVLWRRVSVALGSRRLLFTVPWLILTKPFRQLRIRIKARRNRSGQLTHIV